MDKKSLSSPDLEDFFLLRIASLQLNNILSNFNLDEYLLN
jgi:hypothetical protein